jgi:hypothetical protein
VLLTCHLHFAYMLRRLRAQRKIQGVSLFFFLRSGVSCINKKKRDGLVYKENQTQKPYNLYLKTIMALFAWLISRTFLAKEQCFSLTTNRRTVLFSMAFQQRSLLCVIVAKLCPTISSFDFTAKVLSLVLKLRATMRQKLRRSTKWLPSTKSTTKVLAFNHCPRPITNMSHHRRAR